VKRQFGAILPMLAAAAIALPLGAFARAQSSKQRPPLQKSASSGAYVVNTYFDPDSNTNDAYFEILKDKHLVYQRQAEDNGAKFVIGTLYDDDPDARLVTMGADITGDGQPDLVVSEWSGGANCCLTLHLFEIGKRFRKIGAIDAAYGDQGPHFVHLKGRGLQIQIYDWTFANWHSDFAESPAPRVLLSYQRGAYRIAPGLMSTPNADMKEVAAKISQIRDATKNLHGSWPDADIPPLLWGTMLDLIYSGHRLLAWQVAEMAWPKGVGGKDRFVDDFIAQMKKSPYWKTVASLGS
jgi:hypothetical protein